MSASLLKRAIEAVGPDAFKEHFLALSDAERFALLSNWNFAARPEQLEPGGDWLVWLILAGRGFGKSRTGAETVRKWAREYPGCHIALVARTAADARAVMVEALLHPWRGGYLNPEDVPHHEPSKRLLTWRNGSRATTYSADEPDQLRGPQHDFAWCDELAAWPSSASRQKETGARSVMEEVWHDGVLMGLRGSGAVRVDRPRVVVTTTPRPRRLVRQLLNDPRTHPTRGSTFDNQDNLPEAYIADLHKRYDGTRIGRQELHAEILDDVVGALWTHATIDDNRVETAPDLVRVVVAIDPSGKSDNGDEQGILVCGIGTDGHGYVIADRSTQDSPDGWGQRAVAAYEEFKADRLVAERNFGGEMVEFVVRQAAKTRDLRISYRDVTASRGKMVRAEPVSALYEQGRIHHVGEFDLLEEQMRQYVPGDGGSPDRMDALVWAFTDLMLGPQKTGTTSEYYAPNTESYWNEAEEVQRMTHLKGFV